MSDRRSVAEVNYFILVHWSEPTNPEYEEGMIYKDTQRNTWSRVLSFLLSIIKRIRAVKNGFPANSS